MTEHSIPPFDLTALAKSLEGGAHSIFSASGSHMWIECSGSLIPNILAPDLSGIEAAEGTVAHGVGEIWQRTNKKPRHLIGKVEKVVRKEATFEIEITHEMLDYVQQYVDWCWSTPGSHFIETKVYYDDITPIPKQGGTADHAACSYQKLIITDLKYGKGVQIFAKDNPQIMLYAYGFFNEWDWLYDFQEIELRIAQPRLDHFDTHTISREQLLEFARYAGERSHAAWRIDAPRTPGDSQCRFCRVQATCGAFAAYMASMTDGIYEDLTREVTSEQIDEVKERIDWMQRFQTTPAAELDLSQLSVLYSWRGAIERWFEAVAVEIGRRVARGEHPPLQKLVEARSKRRYRNDDSAKKYLLSDLGLPRDSVITEKLVTPAELERVLMRAGRNKTELPELLEPVVFKPPGKPTLAPLSDRRPALTDVDEGVFIDLTLNPEPEEP